MNENHERKIDERKRWEEERKGEEGTRLDDHSPTYSYSALVLPAFLQLAV